MSHLAKAQAAVLIKFGPSVSFQRLCGFFFKIFRPNGAQQSPVKNYYFALQTRAAHGRFDLRNDTFCSQTGASAMSLTTVCFATDIRRWLEGVRSDLACR